MSPWDILSSVRTLLIAVLLFVLCTGFPARAQVRDTAGPVKVKIAAGSSETPMVLEVREAPAPGDSIIVITSTTRLEVALITPGGQRITIGNAADAGLDWKRWNGDAPLGSTDGGYVIQIVFKKPAIAGRYTLLFTPQAPEAAATAKAWFTSRMQEYRWLIQSVPGAQLPNPVPLGGSASIAMDVGNDMENALLDIVVPDSAVDVVLVLPDGRVARQKQPVEGVLAWDVVSDPEDSNSDLSWFAKFEPLLPLPGTHHVVALRKVPKGRYEIRAAQSGKTGGELRVALLSAEAMKAALAKVIYYPFVAPGEVGIRARLTSVEHFAGEPAELTVGFAGEIGPFPPAFRVRIENSPPVPSDGSSRRFGPPGPIETQPVKFTRGADGKYRGMVVLSREGQARVEVRASGTKASGEPFTAEGITSALVQPVVARVISLDAGGVDVDGDGKFDRLDVTAVLDVIIPGEFMFSACAADAMHRSVPVFATEKLAAGRQKLTASISAGRIWNALRDGPLQVGISIIWKGGATGGVKVPGTEKIARSVAYQRDQWDHGPLYGDDGVIVHGIRPALSGRFSMAEVEWGVTTPGGRCNWSAGIDSVGGVPGLYASQAGEVPPGRRTFNFLFDGGAIAAAGKRDWKFNAEVQCGDRSDRALLPAIVLNLDSRLYEPAHGGLSIRGPVSLVDSGGYWSVMLNPAGKGAEVAHFRLTEVPEGLEASLQEISPGHPAANLFVKAAPGTPPGRYFVGVSAISGDQTANREFVVDVPAKAPPTRADTRVVTLPSPARVAPSQAGPNAPAPRAAGSAATGGLYGVQRIRVGPNVQASRLVRKPAIKYPPLAKTARIQGPVRFTVVIGTDGTVRNVRLLSGHPLLITAAQDAVKQWV